MLTLFLEHSSEYNKIEQWLNGYDIKNYKINPDLTVDVDGNVYLYSNDKLDLPFKFGKISGDFNYYSYRGLPNSDNLPTYVGNDFSLNTNRRLKEIKNGPKFVGRNYNIDENSFTNLEGCPKEIFGSFYARHNQLETLEGGPEIVHGSVNLAGNKLTDLKYSPKKIGGIINLNFNRISSLRYLTFNMKLRKTFIVDLWKNPLRDNGEIERYLQKYLELYPDETDCLIDMELSDEFYYKNSKIFGTDTIEEDEYETEDEYEVDDEEEQ